MIQFLISSLIFASVSVASAQTKLEQQRITNQNSSKLLRQTISKIPLNSHSCIANLGDAGNIIDVLYCDGELIAQNVKIIHVTSMFENTSSEQAASLFIAGMLEFAFELKGFVRTNHDTRYIFQRTHRSEKMESHTF